MDKETREEAVPVGRNLALDAVRVTEAAARAAARLIGRGDEMAADQAAVTPCGAASTPSTSPARW